MRISHQWCPTCQDTVTFAGSTRPKCGYTIPVRGLRPEKFGNAYTQRQRKTLQKGRYRTPEWAT